MVWQLSIYTAFFTLAAVASATVCVIAWQRREWHDSLPFCVLMGGAALWAAGNTLQVSTTALDLKLLFRTLAYMGHNIAPVALVVFALLYTAQSNWVTRRNVVVLALEPMVVAFIVAPANALGWHSLLWTSSSLGTVEGLVILRQTFGPWYWVNTAYNYTLVLTALYLFVYLAIQTNTATRKQGLMLMAGVVPPFCANIAWILGLTLIDLTPLAFTLAGGMFAVAIYRYRLFEIVPVAREIVLDAVNDGYVILDETDRVSDINETASTHAVGTGTHVGRSIHEVFPQCADLLAHHRDKTTGSHGERVQGDVTIDRDAGDPHYFEVQITTISRARFTGRLILLRDLTEQRRVRQWYQALIENASDITAVLDADGNYTYHSPSSERILGYDRATLEGDAVESYIHPNDRDEVLEKFAECVADPDSQPSHQYRFRHADGSWIWLESRARNLLDHPVIEGVVVNSRDISEQKTYENTLRQQNDRLQELANVAAHDLRNPVQVIDGRLSFARESGDDEHFDAMEAAVSRIEDLIEDVLTLLREGDLVREREPIVLADVVDTAWDGVDTADATLVSAVGDLTVDADHSKLRSLLENLFVNAVIHGGSDVTVRVGRTPSGFYVEDDGAGIPEETRPRIFEQGVSTDSEGTGLGLPIVKSIAMAHGWDIELAADSDWTRFEIRNVDRLDGRNGADATSTERH